LLTGEDEVPAGAKLTASNLRDLNPALSQQFGSVTVLAESVPASLASLAKS
jgi:hypothetical protein